MLQSFDVTEKNRQAMWTLAKALEPIYRTLVSPGFEASLERIGEDLPIEILKYPSGQKVFDWTIPQSWTVRGGYLADTNGRRLIEFSDEPLFVGPYSRPFSGKISREELLPHLYSYEHLSDAIPLCPSYYQEDWKLGVPHKLKESLKDEQYYVHIDSEISPGHLCIGEVVLPGETDEEILFSSYMCHPMMANDNLSGVVVAVELFKILQELEQRHYTYRMIIVPETIGSIAYLYHHQKEIEKLVGGFNLTCCGDNGCITFKKSWQGDTLLDRAGVKALRERGEDHVVREYYFSGSDERQFNAPGFRIPMPTIMRTIPGEFPEYHSSLDNLEIISPEKLGDTLQFILHMLHIVDNNKTYLNRYRAEPFLSGYGIFKQVRSGRFGVFHKTTPGVDPGYLNQIVIHETDGKQDLLSIAEKWDCSVADLVATCRVFEQVGLIEETASA